MGVPIVEAVRTPKNLLVFDCPYCWRYGGSTGCCDVDNGGFYKRRPKLAKPVQHVHGGGSDFGDGDGHRVAHCMNPASPFNETGYILKEKRS